MPHLSPQCSITIVSAVQSLSHVWLFTIPWIAARQTALYITSSWSSLKLMSIVSVMPSNHLVPPFFSHLQSFLASSSFQMSWFFTSGVPSIGVLASASVLPKNIQDWSPLGWTGWISLKSKGLSRVFSKTNSKASILRRSVFFYSPTLTSIHHH